MADLIMGHTSANMRRRVYRQFNLDELQRLKAVSDVARDWLYGEA